MKLGVAVPCYPGHIPHVLTLLDSIETQTSKPDKVVVSCSSTTEKFIKKPYSFPLEILLIPDVRNAAQNRNLAGSRLTDMDYITYFDADDVMHPQRIEILRRIFQLTDCDIILHDYSMEQNFSLLNLDTILYRVNSLVQAPSGCITHKDVQYFYKKEQIHHSQSSIKASLLTRVQYPEEKEFCNKEDCVFCYRIFGLHDVHNVYVNHKLSYYKSSNSQHELTV